MRGFAAFLLAVVVCSLFPVSHAEAKRIALVVGNGVYRSLSPLKNSKNDADAIAGALERAGFEVTRVTDADLKTMKRAFLAFSRAMKGDVEATLFYYAGHGVQVRGENYLLPVDAEISLEDEVPIESVAVNDFLQVLNHSNGAVNIVVLDSCRNSPFPASVRSAAAGLAPVLAPTGTFIAYATAPGAVAYDGVGDQGYFAQALSEDMLTPGLEIAHVFRRVRQRVIERTAQRQTPWESSSIVGEFYFVPLAPTVGPVETSKPTEAVSPYLEAATRWKEIEASRDIAALEEFTARFEGNPFADLARARLQELRPKVELQVPAVAPEFKGPATDKTAPTANSPDLEAATRWKELETTRDIAALEGFVAKFKGSPFTALARARLDELVPKSELQLAPVAPEFQKPPAPDNAGAAANSTDVEAAARWKEIETSGDKAALEEFIAKFKGSPFAALARARLKSELRMAAVAPELQIVAVAREFNLKAETQWKELETSRDIAALEEFAATFNGTPFADRARARLEKLRSKSELQVAAVAPEFDKPLAPEKTAPAANAPPFGEADQAPLPPLTRDAIEAAKKINTSRGWQLLLAKFGRERGVAELGLSELHKLSSAGGAAPSAPELERALHLSSQGRTEIQTRLAALGFPIGQADGVFGQRTRNTLASYQQSIGLPATGYVDFPLLSALGLGLSDLTGGDFKSDRKAQYYDADQLKLLGEHDRVTEVLRCLRVQFVVYGKFQGHVYIAVQGPWTGSALPKMLAKKCGAHLVTISSKAENDFVYSLISEDERFFPIGLHGRDFLKSGPLIGLEQASGAAEPRGGWAWSNGERASFRNWGPREPSNSEGREHVAQFFASRRSKSAAAAARADTWNDSFGGHGYILEAE